MRRPQQLDLLLDRERVAGVDYVVTMDDQTLATFGAEEFLQAWSLYSSIATTRLVKMRERGALMEMEGRHHLACFWQVPAKPGFRIPLSPIERAEAGSAQQAPPRGTIGLPGAEGNAQASLPL